MVVYSVIRVVIYLRPLYWVAPTIDSYGEGGVMNPYERKAWDNVINVAKTVPSLFGTPWAISPGNLAAILAADVELTALRARVAVLEKENKILEKVARGCLGTLFAETYLRELRALDAAK